MRLSSHFTLKELTFSQTAQRHDLYNTPNGEQFGNIQLLCYTILEPVRKFFDLPFSPSSGYRCLELNRLIGSKDTSQHLEGRAVDFEIPGIPNKDVADWIDENLSYDQLILEYYDPEVINSGWIHVSYQNLLQNRRHYFGIS